MGWLILVVLVLLVLCWALGANNRLVRLRAEVMRQWALVDTIWLKWLLRFQGSVAARQILAWSSEMDDLQSLQDACEAVVEALADARQQMLDADSQQKLLQRHEALMQCIDDVATRVPVTIRPYLQSAQTRILQNIPPALVPYHQAAVLYNDALTQAPACWLARRRGLQPAQLLRLPVRVEVQA